MICEKCQDEGHYWFADDDVAINKELGELIGIYAWCDMRQVFSTLTGCECGCHDKEGKLKGTKYEQTALFYGIRV